MAEVLYAGSFFDEMAQVETKRVRDNVMEATVAKDTDPNGTSYVQLMDIWGEDVHFTCAHLPSTGELYQIGVRADNAEARKMLLQGLKFLIKGLEEEEDE